MVKQGHRWLDPHVLSILDRMTAVRCAFNFGQGH